MKLKYGGDLQFGDFIAVANQNCLSFGWYAGRGKSGTLQYYSVRSPRSVVQRYELWENKTDAPKWENEHYEKGLSIKLLWKEYIYGDSMNNRVVKITDPEAIFTDEMLQIYLESKDALIKLKFLEK